MMSRPSLERIKELIKNQQSASESICLGIITQSFSDQLYAALEESIIPYGTNNKFSRDAYTTNIILPGDIAYRYTTLTGETNTQNIIDFCQNIKQHAKEVLMKCIDKIEAQSDNDWFVAENYPPCIEKEEQGYLGLHIVILPKKDAVYRPTHMFLNQSSGKHIRNRKRNYHVDSQGGDPRSNLEHRLNRDGINLWTINQAIEPASKLFSGGNSDCCKKDIEIFKNEELPEHPIDIYIAVWRRPFYLSGLYTKTRRDVSQTPFFVVDDGKRRRLGATSVEEEITSVITKYCGEISTLNNDPKMTNVIFGMAKFHASGREDMDVRMLLPSVSHQEHIGTGSKKITGRPFAYEIIDALRLPPMDSLNRIIEEINHFTKDNNIPDPDSYGRNPMGVGISSELKFVPSSSFKQLQAETEEKVKHYGCLCWSEKKLPSSADELLLKLGTFPLQIQQLTPIRVLHRRARMTRTRHVLSCGAQLIDDHHFRLHISTDAGTYVKEFVHSDLGRTKPSVSSLLGCRTDILELDCEGIEV